MIADSLRDVSDDDDDDNLENDSDLLGELSGIGGVEEAEEEEPVAQPPAASEERLAMPPRPRWLEHSTALVKGKTCFLKLLNLQSIWLFVQVFSQTLLHCVCAGSR